jgi:hypothetical protein
METWINRRAAALVCGAMLLLPAIGVSAAGAGDTFDLAAYREMKKSDPRTLGLVLTAMRETVFYAQGSIGRPAPCATPRPIPVTKLIDLVEREIAAPTNPAIRAYADNHQVAFVFVSAMKQAAYCD